MAKPIVIAVVGLAGAGKTDVSARFAERGFLHFKYSDAVYEEMQRLGHDITVHNEALQRKIREGLRKEFGMGFAADRIMPRVEAAVKRGDNVVIESLYSWSEYKKTKERFGDQFKTLAIYAPPELRYERLFKRAYRPIRPEDARSRDYTEIENIEKAGPIAMADHMIINTGTKDELLGRVDEFIDKLLNQKS